MDKTTLIHKITKEAELSVDEVFMLQHDINNLRGNEWLEVVEKNCSEEIKKAFKNLIGLNTKRLHISMAYTYVGDTEIDIPLELIKGKSEEEQYKIAFQYAQDHLGEIPVANNAEYVLDSDNFDMDDIEWEEE